MQNNQHVEIILQLHLGSAGYRLFQALLLKFIYKYKYLEFTTIHIKYGIKHLFYQNMLRRNIIIFFNSQKQDILSKY